MMNTDNQKEPEPTEAGEILFWKGFCGVICLALAGGDWLLSRPDEKAGFSHEGTKDGGSRRGAEAQRDCSPVTPPRLCASARKYALVRSVDCH